MKKNIIKFLVVNFLLIATFSNIIAQPYSFSKTELQRIKKTFPTFEIKLFCKPNSDVIYYSSWNWFGKTEDLGQTWIRLAHPGIGSHELEFSLLSDNIIYAYNCMERSLMKSLNGGLTWLSLYDKYCEAFALDPSNDQIMYAAFSESDTEHKIYKITDDGSTWTQLTDANGLPANAEYGVLQIKIPVENPSTIFIVLDNNGVYKSTNSGDNFTQILNGDYKQILIQDAFGEKLIIAYHFGNYTPFISWSDDGGSNWTASSHNTGFVDATQSFVFNPDKPDTLLFYNSHDNNNNEGKLLRSIDRGDNFIEVGPITNYFQGVGDINMTFLNTSTNSVFAVVSAGKKIFKSTDAGLNWEILEPPTDYDMTRELNGGNKRMIPLLNGNLFSASPGFVNIFDKDQNLWTEISANQLNNSSWLNFITCDSENNDNVWVISGNKLYRSSNGGNSWSIYYDFGANFQFYGGNFFSIREGDNLFLFASTPDNHLIKSSDEGITFNQIAIDGLTNAITAIHYAPSSSNTMYLGTSGGNMYKSTNLGDDWTLLPNSPANTAYYNSPTGMIVHPSNPDIVVNYELNTIYKTTDGGDTWIQSQTGFTDLYFFSRETFLFDRTNTDILFNLAKDNDGNFYLVYSTDAGSTWSDNQSFLIDNLPNYEPGSTMLLPNLSDNNKLYVYIAYLGFYEITIPENVGIKDIIEFQNIAQIFPNPSNGLITIEINNSVADDILIEITGANGQVVYKKRFNSVNKTEQIDLSENAKGIYFVRVKTKDFKKVGKLIIE